MGVMWWWLGAAVLVALVGVGLLRLLGRSRRRGQDESALWLAHAERLRSLPRFRQLAAARARWARIGLVGLALAALGTGLLAARVIRVSNDDELMRNRDVMLCLDVSPSMEGIDVPVVDTYQRLSQRLDSERIGLVAFDSGAVTLFPLTSDAGFVQARLTDAGRQVADLERNPIAGTRVGDSGSSLVGDGAHQLRAALRPTRPAAIAHDRARHRRTGVGQCDLLDPAGRGSCPRQAGDGLRGGARQ